MPITKEQQDALTQVLQALKTANTLEKRSQHWLASHGQVPGYQLQDYVSDTYQCQLQMQRVIATMQSYLTRWPEPALAEQLVRFQRNSRPEMLTFWQCAATSLQ